MLDTLRFVSGAVAQKEYIPVLTHFNIREGRVVGYNGRIALSSPIALDLEANPRAESFVRAIATCESEVALSLTPAGRLAVVSGSFKAFVECTTEPYPNVRPSGQHVRPNGNFVQALRRLLPFVGNDASRPWASGILLNGHSAYATNNIIVAEHWLGFPFPATVNVPKSTVEELLRIGQEPLGLQVDESTITFHYDGDRWLHSLLYTTAWPDVPKLLARQPAMVPLPPEFFTTLAALRPFADKEGRVYLSQHGMATSLEEGTGASAALTLWPKPLTFHVDQLSLLASVAQWFDPEGHPHMWYGDNIRGAIAGMRA